MSLERDVTEIMEAEGVFKPASREEADQRKATARKSILDRFGELWISLRFVRGKDRDHAIENVILGRFVEGHELSDNVVPAAQVTVNGEPIVDGLEEPLEEAQKIFKPATARELKKRRSAVVYNVWVEVERLDENNEPNESEDIFTEKLRQFDSEEAAIKFAGDIIRQHEG